MITNPNLNTRSHLIEEFWLKRLKDSPNVPFPVASREWRGDAGPDQEFAFPFPEETLALLLEASRGKAAGQYVLLLSALVVLLQRYSGLESFPVCSPVPGSRADGSFGDRLWFHRVPVAADMPVADVVGRVKTQVKEAVQFQEMAVEGLISKCAELYELAPHLLFQVCLDFPAFGGHNPFYDRHGLIFQVDTGSGPELRLIFSTDFIAAEYVEFLGGQFLQTLHSILEKKDLRVEEVRVLPAAQRQRILVDFNAHDPAYVVDQTVMTLFEAQVKRSPEAPAVVFEGDQLSFDALNRRANRIAHFLRSVHHVQPDERVAMVMARGLDMIVTVTGILKSGGAYTPVDVSYPEERIAHILSDSGAKVVLTDAGHAELVSRLWDGPVVLADAVPEGPDSNPLPVAGPDNLAFVMYTSGSTGKPKGVMQTHACLSNVALSQLHHDGFDPGPLRILQFASVGFDVSIGHEIAYSLISGGCLFPVPEVMRHQLSALGTFIVEQGIEWLYLTSSTLNTLVEVSDAVWDERSHIRHIATGGEQVKIGERLNAFLMAHPGISIWNYYGPTETHYVTSTRLSPVEGRYPALPSIGRPIPYHQVYLLDAVLQPTPVGVKGELYVAGAGLARGYLNRDSLTAERFPAHPFVAGARVYKTGDLAFWTPAGTLVFCGRSDHQVKIRGQRVEPGEIEVCLEAHALVERAVVLAQEQPVGVRQVVPAQEQNGGERARVLAQEQPVGVRQVVPAQEQNGVERAVVLAQEQPVGVRQVVPAQEQNGERTGPAELEAFVVLKGAADSAVLRQWLAERLPEYMIPSRFFMVDAIPLNSNGKADRLALAATHAQNLEAVVPYVAPRDDLELQLARIWEQVFDRSQIGIHAHFFDLGGHSLKATQMIAAIHKEMGVMVDLRTIFECPTIASLADAVREAPAEALAAIPVLPPAEDYVLSHSQQRLWILGQREASNIAYNMSMAYLLEGDLQASVLEAATARVVARHESLRTVFITRDGLARQVILPPEDLDFRVEWFDRLDAAVAAVRDEAFQAGMEAMDLEQGPLLKARVYRLGPDRHLLAVCVHHIIADGWSVGLMIQEFLSTYDALIRGEEPAFPALPIQYKDYSAWQHALLSGEGLDAERAYWHQQLRDPAPPLKLLTDRPRPKMKTYHGAKVDFVVEGAVRDRIMALCRQEELTLYVWLLATVKVFLYQQSGQEDIVTGSPVSGRTHASLKNLVGFFVNTLVLRDRMDGAHSFLDFAASVRETVTEAHAHQRYPFDLLVSELGAGQDPGRTPFFDVWMVLENDAPPEFRMEGLRAMPVIPDVLPGKFDLLFSFLELPDHLGGTIEYNTDLFDEATVVLFKHTLLDLLMAAVDDPHASVDSLCGNPDSAQASASSLTAFDFD